MKAGPVGEIRSLCEVMGTNTEEQCSLTESFNFVRVLVSCFRYCLLSSSFFFIYRGGLTELSQFAAAMRLSFSQQNVGKHDMGPSTHSLLRCSLLADSDGNTRMTSKATCSRWQIRYQLGFLSDWGPDAHTTLFVTSLDCSIMIQ